MNMPRLIERKRDGAALTDAEWAWVVRGFVSGEVPDYQMSAMAMAIVFRGMTDGELTALTRAMVESGDRFDLTDWPVPRVGKHSLGGVGDKTSLLIAPMIAELGLAVPKMSGRGLGHTGGTLDKLESIPGFRTNLSLAEARRQLEELGVVMIGQTAELVPADRKLYALRDVTGTVESIPLLASSIMSKKLAESLNALVLDVKTGSGAFIADPQQSLVLARAMIHLGEANQCRTVALITAMDRPLGSACGNAIEVAEAIRGLRGEGPPDLMEVTFALGAEMLVGGGVEADRPSARARLDAVIRSGRALERFRRLITAQGGDPRVVDDPSRLPTAPVVELLKADRGGRVGQIEPRAIGHAIIDLGGGRTKATDSIDHRVGVRLRVGIGDQVSIGDALAEIHAATHEAASRARVSVQRAITIGEGPESLPLILHRVTKHGIESWA